MATLHLLCGLPGAGKTTLAKRLQSSRGAVRLCPDEWIQRLLDNPTDRAGADRIRDRVEALQWATARELLGLGVSLILENGFWSRAERERLRDEARGLGARVELHLLDIPAEELWRRIERRNADAAAGSFRIGREEFESWLPLFTPPDSAEIATYDAFSRASDGG